VIPITSLLLSLSGIVFAETPGSESELAKVTELLKSGEQTVRIVCFGDSITGVYYHTGGRRAWCDMLGIALKKIYHEAKIEMINAGISGHSTVQALQRIEKAVLSRKPHLVVVMFGMNDVVAGDLAKFRENMKEIIRRCRAMGAAVVLCTPNAIFPEDPRRPVNRLAEYAAAIRTVAGEQKVPVVDCHAAYEAVKIKNPLHFEAMMSDAIHPAMTGHKLFAEEIANVIAKKRVSLADVGPLPLSIPHTLRLLKEGKPIKLVAMEPYDVLVPKILTELNPSAKVEVIPWHAHGKSIAELEAWAKGLRDMHPNLVVVAVPVSAKADRIEPFIRSYHWILNWGLSFGLAQWDLVVVSPSVGRAAATTQPTQTEQLVKDITLGHDIGLIERSPADQSTPEQLLSRWFKAQVQLAGP